MGLREAFTLGGWGMWPTALFGVLMVGAAGWYAASPGRRLMPLVVSLGVITLTSGILGCTMGVIKSLGALNQVGPELRYIWLIGLSESLVNVAFALVLVVLAALATAVGALRLARSPQQPAVA